MFDALLSLILVVALLLGSPGPAPLALAAAGASVGVTRGLPFLFGILCGLLVAIIGTTIGLATLFSLYPSVRVGLQIVGGVYIFYVALKIAMAPVISAGNSHKLNAPSFADGFILNLLNPKAYAAFLAIFSQFLLPLQNQLLAFILTGIVCMIVALAVDSIWLLLGGALKSVFKQPFQARVLRITFAISMVFTVIWASLQ